MLSIALRACVPVWSLIGNPTSRLIIIDQPTAQFDVDSAEEWATHYSFDSPHLEEYIRYLL